MKVYVWFFVVQLLLCNCLHGKDCQDFDRIIQSWNGGRNGEICIYVSETSKLDIEFSAQAKEFNPYCLVPTKTFDKQASAYRINKGWCKKQSDGAFCIAYTLRSYSSSQVTFKSVKENGNSICGSNGSAGTTNTGNKGTTNKKNGCKYNYKEVLHKSLLFYEAQRSGYLPASNRIPWRRSSMLNDGRVVSHDLVGGYFDAGDYVKFSFPMASSITLLAWGMIEFSDGYKLAGEYQNGLDAIKWATDYFIKAHTANYQLWVQVGDGHEDHKFWGRPEQYPKDRPCYEVNKNKPGSDVAGEVSAALAAASILFKKIDATYSATLLKHAKEIYDFANTYRGKYSDSVPQVRDFYKSYNGYMDELVWSAAWLYKATREKRYLTMAKQHWNSMDSGSKLSKEVSWDSKVRVAAILLAETTKEKDFVNNGRALCQWAQSFSSPKTNQGLLFISKWGANRYAANIAFACLAFTKYFPSKDFDNFSQKQIHLLLGDAGRSFVVGFGHNPPQRPHHSSSSCPHYPAPCGWNEFRSWKPNPHILYGALVGGPKDNSGSYQDKRDDYICNEVTTDYNAGFQSAIAALLSKNPKCK